jgi:signal transduction histidine kinase
MAAMAAEKVEMVLRDVPDDVIARLRAAAGVRDVRPGALEALVTDPAVRQHLEKTLGGLEAPTILALLDPQDRPVYARESIAQAQRLASARLREGLPNWQIALYQPPGFVPHQPVRTQVMLFTCVLGVLLVVILAGTVTTYRLARRESEVARLKADFVANVSHDLKTPLSVIRMFGETLELGRVTDPAQRAEYYRVITRESERLSRLIDNVLDFSRIEGGRRTYERAPAPVEPLVRESLEPFAYPLAQGGFKVEVDVAPDLPDVVMDAAAVAQALSNLIDNAIKYSGERRALRVEAALADGELALSVSDEGLGIPPAEHARIFEKFYRVGRSDTQGRRGSGVGLALVRHVAEAHRGRVTVESRPGAGSRFTIHLPVR